jgi:DNA-binding LacI/PurR family transcriptional regulator
LIGIRELARHLDISIGTVSRALNGKADVNPETRKRVLEAASTLGYAPNQSGRSLRRGMTGLVGVIVPSDPEQTLVDSVFAGVLNGLRRFLSGQGLDLAIFLYVEDEEDAFSVLRRIAGRRLVDALIISQTQRSDPRIGYLLGKSLPFVAFGRSERAEDHAFVDMDFDAAVEGAVERLAALGHRRMAALVPAGELNYSHLIAEQFQVTLARLGLPHEAGAIHRCSRGEGGGYEAASALLAERDVPTAVLTADRKLAIGLYKRLNEAGLAPCRDMSVICVNCDAQAQFLSPVLSSYQADLPMLGQELGQALEAVLAEAKTGLPAAEFSQVLMPMRYVEGGSTSERSGIRP